MKEWTCKCWQTPFRNFFPLFSIALFSPWFAPTSVTVPSQTPLLPPTLGSQFPLWLTSLTHFLSFSPHPSPQCFHWPFCGNDWHLCVSSPDFSLTLGPLCQLPPGISTWMRSPHPKFSMSNLKSHLGSLFQSAMHHFPSHPNSKLQSLHLLWSPGQICIKNQDDPLYPAGLMQDKGR